MFNQKARMLLEGEKGHAEHLAVHGGDPEASMAALDVGLSSLDTLTHAGFTGLKPSRSLVGTASRGCAHSRSVACLEYAPHRRKPRNPFRSK